MSRALEQAFCVPTRNSYARVPRANEAVEVEGVTSFLSRVLARSLLHIPAHRLTGDER